MTSLNPKPDSESDVPADDAVAQSRATGGDPGSNAPDATSTTGTGETEEFVGRAAGDDLGYAGETGAERRQQANEG